MQAFLQRLIEPALQFLQRAVTSLANLNLIVKRGIDLGSYLGPIGVLGPGWRAAIATLGGAVIIVIVLSIAIGMYRLYLAFKAGVKWW